MKIFILRNASVNRLLDKELERLMDAEVEFAITDNNGMFGIDNVSGWASNMNTLVFIWQDNYDENLNDWIDKVNNSANAVAEVIYPIFKFYSEANPSYIDEWKDLKNKLNHMNSGNTMIYDISRGIFIA